MRASTLTRLAFALAAATLFSLGCSNGGASSPDGQPGGDSGLAPQCSDGVDNDGDGKIDFPNDPGCLNPNQNSETDDCPDGPNCPQCGNGKDDDGDGKIDFGAGPNNDPDCTSASDPTERGVNAAACGQDVPVMPLPNNGVASGTIVIAASHMISKCGGLGPETAYEIDLTAPTVVVASTDMQGTGVDTVISVRGAACTDPASELGCNDNASSSTTASTMELSLQPGTYYLIVDAATSTAAGAYQLSVKEFPGVGQACDTTNVCGPGYFCRAAPGASANTCQPPRCSDGYDNDTDTHTDYPADPGCSSPADDDETDDCPDGPNCPACSNGKDDDGDQKIDYGTGVDNDPDCLSAGQPIEGCGSERDPMIALTTGTYTGDTTNLHDDWASSCAGTGYNDEVFLVVLPRLDSLSISEDTTDPVNSVVVALEGNMCNGDLACGWGFMGSPATIDRTNVSAGLYAIVADSDDGNGPFTLTVSGVISPGARCDVPLFASGALSCGSGTTCDGTICKGTNQCDDGIENDTDGKIDYPNDPGCTSPTDDSEADDCPSGPNCPACSNHKDDDLDGQTDWPADTACTSAAGTSESCASTEAPVVLTAAATNGDTTSKANDFEPSCVATTGGPDIVYQLDLPAMVSLHADAATSGWYADLQLLDSSCGNGGLDCAYSSIDEGALAAGRYFVVVDGDSDTDFGTFTLNVSGLIAANGSCEGPLATSGALTCAAGYKCAGATGARTCTPTQCNDGVENDTDGKIDYPNDPGCTSPSDDSELDDCPNGPNCPACSNNKDDDMDGMKDYPADTSCKSAAGTSESCASVDPVLVLTQPMTTGSTAGATDDFEPSCGSTGSPDQVYQLDLPAMTTVTVDMSVNNFDEVITVLDSSCGSTELGCNDTPGALTLGPLAAGRYFVDADGYFDTDFGTFVMSVSGKIAQGGACEGALATSGAISCDAGLTCKGTAGSKTCAP